MRISGVEVFLVAVPSRREHTWASKMETPIGHHAIVRLDTDEGVSGWGEAPAIATWGGAHMRYYGETPETVKHIVESYLLPAIREVDPAEVAVVHSRMDRVGKGHPYAKAAGGGREGARSGGRADRKPRDGGRVGLDRARHPRAVRARGGCVLLLLRDEARRPLPRAPAGRGRGRARIRLRHRRLDRARDRER